MSQTERSASCLFEAIVASHQDALFTIDASGVIGSWNTAAQRLFGYTRAEALGRRDSELLAPPPGVRALPGNDPALRALSAQAIVRRRDGHALSVLVTRTPVQPAPDMQATTLVSVHLLSEPARGAGAMREAALQPHPMHVYESLVESSDDAIVTKTLGGIVTSWNPGAQRMFGFSAAEMIGEPITKLIPPERLHEEEMILDRIGAGERVEHFETERLHKNGKHVHVSVTISPLRDALGRVVGASKIARDIGERLRAAQTIWQQANQDPLTELPNRHAFRQHLLREIARAEREGSQLSLLYIDLDHFKAVNDSLGHAAGDALLVAVARRMRSALRGSDVLARLGGDEFTVLLPAQDGAPDGRAVGAKLQAALAAPFEHAEHPIHICASVGVACYPHDGHIPDELLRHADLAMYEAKHGGRNRTVMYDASMDQRARGRLLLAGDLRRAAQQGELYLVYQPVLSTTDRSLSKFEALMRWQHPAFGTVHPARFIALAEETGFILELGDWVFRCAAAQAHAWQQLRAASRDARPVQVAFNVSPLQLSSDTDPTLGWIDHARSLGLAPGTLVVEVTETVIFDDSPRIAQRLGQLRRNGFQIAVDDFGTGLSNLASLSRVEVDYLKIDQSLIRRLPGDARKLAICQAIVEMAHRLGLKVVAEGIETEEELRKVQEIRCDFAQGYLYARPLPGEQATQWMLAAMAAC